MFNNLSTRPSMPGRCTSLTNLDLGCNALGDEGMCLLVPSIANVKALVRLSLVENNIGDVGARALLGTLQRGVGVTGGALRRTGEGLSHPALEELHIVRSNQIGTRSVVLLWLFVAQLIWSKPVDIDVHEEQLNSEFDSVLREITGMEEITGRHLFLGGS